MNLLTVTTRYFLGLLLMLLVLCSAISYAVMRYAVNSNIDEILFNRRNAIIRTFARQQGVLPRDAADYNDFILKPLPRSVQIDTSLRYSDTLIYEPTDQEEDEYRKLQTQFSFQGKPYALTIVRTHLENPEIIGTISATLIPLYLFVIGGLLIAGRYLTQRLWTPFYHTLTKLTEFDLDSTAPIQFEPAHITEFEALNQAVSGLTARNQRAYQQQKQFIENASHEMQTPLAVIQTKIELLYQQPQLGQQQASLLHAVGGQTERLTRLNKALLLLSKIDNRQFTDRTRVVWADIVTNILPYFEEQAEKYSLTIHSAIEPGAHVHTNPVLADILLSNLLKNAFVHNVPNGQVNIRTEGRTLTVENTGEAPDIAPDLLFERFRKASRQKQTLGLGLAIVKSIVDVNGWQISYVYADGQHRVSVNY
ncbi:type IX secretion system histidine kinase PorY [Fibrella aquatica]|uniref:sensor histidine kinase n=1 Tax=Fibrella aquatica TaxID=3242487 RepID=UPI00352273FC